MNANIQLESIIQVLTENARIAIIDGFNNYNFLLKVI